MGLNLDMKMLVSSYLFNDEMKAKLLKALNENIDIPIIGEKTEAKILDAIYDTVEEIVKKELLS